MRGHAEPGDVVGTLRAALHVYRGDLLADEGPAEWVTADRLRLQAAAANLASELAQIEMSLGNVDAAIDACQRGIDVDRMHDAAWRILIRAYEAAGDVRGGAGGARDRG
jgi:two-component SAPR family response regulator